MWKFIPTVVQPIQGDIGGIIRLLLIEKYSSASSVNFKCAAADVPESLKTFAPFFNLLKVSVKKKRAGIIHQIMQAVFSHLLKVLRK